MTRKHDLTVSIDRGVRFLLDHRSSHGLWHDYITHAGRGVDWPSGIVLNALLTAESGPDVLRQCATLLMDRQHSDGGWGYHADVPTDADSSATILVFLNRIGGYSQAAFRAAECLLNFQDETGGVATYTDTPALRNFLRAPARVSFRGWCRPTSEVTARAGRALLSTSRRFRLQAERAWQFLRAETANNPGAPYWWQTPHYVVHERLVFYDLLCKMGATPTGEAEAVTSLPVASEPTASSFAAALKVQSLCLALNSREEVSAIIDFLLERQESEGGWTGDAWLKIPSPDILRSGSYPRWTSTTRGTNVMTRDYRGLVTTATVIEALVLFRKRTQCHLRPALPTMGRAQ